MYNLGASIQRPQIINDLAVIWQGALCKEFYLASQLAHLSNAGCKLLGKPWRALRNSGQFTAKSHFVRIVDTLNNQPSPGDLLMTRNNLGNL